MRSSELKAGSDVSNKLKAKSIGWWRGRRRVTGEALKKRRQQLKQLIESTHEVTYLEGSIAVREADGDAGLKKCRLNSWWSVEKKKILPRREVRKSWEKLGATSPPAHHCDDAPPPAECLR